MRSRYKIHNENGIFFVTSTIVEWNPIFVNETYYGILIDSLKFYQQNNNLIIYAFVLMNNHFHLIVSNENLSRIMQSFKKYTAKKIIHNLQIDKKYSVLKVFRDVKPDYKTTSLHQIWQEGFHPQEMQNLEMVKQKIEYIHNNPVRKNLVKNPEDWKYSSAIDYLTDKKGLLEIVRIA